MAGFITDWVTDTVTNSLSGLASGAISTTGGYAGTAVNGLGNLIEGAGEKVGNGSAFSSSSFFSTTTSSFALTPFSLCWIGLDAMM